MTSIFLRPKHSCSTFFALLRGVSLVFTIYHYFSLCLTIVHSFFSSQFSPLSTVIFTAFHCFFFKHFSHHITVFTAFHCFFATFQVFCSFFAAFQSFCIAFHSFRNFSLYMVTELFGLFSDGRNMKGKLLEP